MFGVKFNLDGGLDGMFNSSRIMFDGNWVVGIEQFYGSLLHSSFVRWDVCFLICAEGNGFSCTTYMRGLGR